MRIISLLEMEEALQYGADCFGHRELHRELHKEQKEAIISVLQGKFSLRYLLVR